MPSVSIVMQNGHALAMVFAPVSSSWSVRFTFTRSLFCSSIHICAPPAPQQSPRCLVQYSGSTSSTPGMRLQDLARRIVDAVVPAEVAAVVVDDAPRRPAFVGTSFPSASEAEEEVRVVHDFDLQRRSRGTRSSAC